MSKIKNVPIETVNSVISNLTGFRYGNIPDGLKILKTEIVNECNGEHANQGEEGETIKIFSTDDGFFVKVSIGTDSYGDNEFVRSVKFVTPQEKTVVVYD